MALKNPVQFENEIDGDTAVMEAPVAAVEVAAALVPQRAQALAMAAPTSEAILSFQRQVEAMKGAGDFSYGLRKTFKAMPGGTIEQAGVESNPVKLGRWAKVFLKAWDYNHVITSGSDGKEAKDFVAYSRDGKTIDSVIGQDFQQYVGRPVAEYLAFLRDDQEFDNAKVKQEIDAICALLESEDGEDFRETIQITFNPSSVMEFKKYQTDLEDIAWGVANNLPGYVMPDQPFIFYVIRENVSSKGFKWVKLRLARSLPAKL